jgi:hypothetical protein
MNFDMPLACDMTVFAAAQREQHLQATTQLFQAIQSIHEAENGYEFTLRNDSSIITGIGEFISNERICCPFLEFSLKVVSDRGPISFTLTGPAGTQEFLREEFKEVFA